MSIAQTHEVPAVQTVDLRREFRTRGIGIGAGKTIVALDRVSLAISQGEIFGLLGRNGAGKTTLIKILTTLLAPTSGQAFVNGLDVTRHVIPVRQRIAMVSGGEQSGYGILTVREQLWMFAQFYGVPSPVAHKRIGELLEAVDLADQANQKIYALSTGMRQRINLCRALVSDPEILFLDEPTVGLDVEAARVVRNYVRSWMQQNPRRTVLLTTQVFDRVSHWTLCSAHVRRLPLLCHHAGFWHRYTWRPHQSPTSELPLAAACLKPGLCSNCRSGYRPRWPHPRVETRSLANARCHGRRPLSSGGHHLSHSHPSWLGRKDCAADAPDLLAGANPPRIAGRCCRQDFSDL